MNAPVKPQGLSLASIIALIRKEIEQAKTEGPQGEDGKEGAKGERGAKGDTGPQGKAGPKGGNGKQGKAGKDGKDGKDGDDGVGIKDIHQDGDDTVVITMTDGEVYELEMPNGNSTEVRYHSSGGGGSSGTVDLAPYVLRPTSRMSGWLAYREDGNTGEWTPLTTDLVAVNPNQFRDAKGRFAPTPKELESIDNQRDVNEFLYGKIQEVGGEHGDFATKESLANEADMRRTKDEFLQDQIDSNQSQIDNIQEKGYDDTEIRKEIAEESVAREKAIEAEKWERSLADIGLRDALQEEIDILKQDSFGELDDKINTESETRRVADQGLQAEINSLAVTLAAESEQREGSDADLQGQIDAISEKGYDDTEIKEGLAAEIVAREAGDEDLQNQIDAISEKGYDDTEIKEGLADEISTREAEDKALQKQIEDEKAERSLADIGLRDGLKAEIDAIEIPSIDGLATEEYVDNAIDAIPETDLSDYAKTEYVDDAVSAEADARREADAGLQSEVENLANTVASLDIPSIDGLATEEYVDAGDSLLQGQIDALEPYDDTVIKEDLAKEEKERAKADTALTKQIENEKTERSLADIGLRDALTAEINAIEIPSLDGYATEEYVDGAIGAIEFPETDLSGYYTKTEVDESQAAQDSKITANEGGVADNAKAIEEEAEAREQEDTQLQAEIDQLALALEALLVQREAGQWKYIGFSGDNIPRNPGEFSLISEDLSATENNITINQTDLSDKFHGFGDVAVGDYVEIVDLDKPDEYALFVVDSEPNGTGIVSMNLKLKDKGNNFLIGTTCEIRFFQLNEQDLDLTELDARYLTKKGGKTDGILILGYEEEVTNDEAAAQIGFVKTHVDEAIQRIPPPDLSAYALTDYVDEADLDLQQQIDAIEIPSLDGYATEEYVDTAIDAIDFPEIDTSDLVSKTGGDEMEGPLVIQAQGSDGRATNKVHTLGVYSNSEGSALRLGTTGDRVYIGHKDTEFNGPIKVGEIQEKNADKGVLLANQTSLAEEGTEPNHLVTKSYVDAGDKVLQDQFDAIEIPSLDGYATEEYVDSAIDAIEIPSVDGLATEEYVNAGDKALQDQLDAIDLPDFDGSDYVSKTEGDQTMTGPLTISGLGTWDGAVLIAERMEASSDSSTLKIGTPSKQDALRVYKDKVKVSSVPFVCKTIQEYASGYGTTYEGAFTDPDHIATKKDLDSIGGGGGDTSDLVKKSGDVMTGTLETPDLIVKDITPGTEASVLIEGWVNGTNSAARILMSNKQYSNAYGSIQFKGNNADGWFQINKDLDVAGKGVHSVTRIRFSGEKAIQDGNTNRILLNGKVTIPKAGDSNVDGFTVKGKTNGGNNSNLLYVYHNASGLDALNYAGKQSAGTDNIATCKYVDNKVSAGGGSALVSTSFGCKYYRSSNSNGLTFYTQDSNNALNSAHSSTKFINVRLPSDFWTVKAGVSPAGTDMGYITITDISDGKVFFSGQVISVSSGGATFKVDAKKDLWATGNYTEGRNYLIRMESCFREA